MKRLFTLILLAVFLLGFVSAIEPFCRDEGSGDVCYLFGTKSININVDGKNYNVLLKQIDQNGADFIVNGKDTGYLMFNEKKLVKGLIIHAGEVEFDEEMGSELIIFLYEKPSFFQKINCWFSSSC